MEKNIFDVIVIGGGPIGMFASYYCGLRNLKTVLLESMPVLGGQLKNLYPEKYIRDLPGFPKITAENFINNLYEQLVEVEGKVKIFLSNEVIDINKIENIFEIKTKTKKFHSKGILICTGKGAFSPRKLGIENEEEIENISYCVKKTEYYRDKKVIIFGGGDSAVDLALQLNEVTNNITLVHRREEFRAIDSSVEKLKQSNVKILVPYILENIETFDNKLKNIYLENKNTNNIQKIENIDEIIVNYGNITNINFIKNITELNLNNRLIKVDRNFSSNINGIFSCGDSCTYENRQIQIATGLGEVVIATAEIYKFLSPDNKKFTIR